MLGLREMPAKSFSQLFGLIVFRLLLLGRVHSYIPLEDDIEQVGSMTI